MSGVSEIGRNTAGVRLINLDEGDAVRDVARVVTDENEPVEGDGAESATDGGAEAPPADVPEDADGGAEDDE